MLLVLNQKPLVDLIDIELKRIIKALNQCKNSRTKKWKQNKGIKKIHVFIKIKNLNKKLTKVKQN